MKAVVAVALLAVGVVMVAVGCAVAFEGGSDLAQGYLGFGGDALVLAGVGFGATKVLGAE